MYCVVSVSTVNAIVNSADVVVVVVVVTVVVVVVAVVTVVIKGRAV